MRTFLRSMLPLALLVALTSCNDTTTAANERRVVVFFTTDEHSQLFAVAPEVDDFLTPAGATGTGKLVGGVERRMTILQAQRSAAAQRGSSVATITLSSGDFSQGALASAAWLATSPELASMKLMGYDVASLGNHEFDLGDAALAQAISKAVSLTDGSAQRPQLLLSNLDPTKATALAPLYGPGKPVAPYTVLTPANGIKIGVVASLGVQAGTVAGAAPANAFWPATATTTTAQFAAVAAQVQAAVNAVRAQGVDAVILLAHGGIGPDPQHPGEDELMAQALSGVDVVLSGHSHSFTPQPRIAFGSGKSVPVIQPKPYGQNLGKIELVFVDNGVQGNPPRPYLDPSGTQFFDVNDTTAKTTDTAFVTDLQTRTIGFLEFGLDGPTSTALPSFLESTLTKIVGAPVQAQSARPGALWNFPLGTGLPNSACTLTFDVTQSSTGESNALNLDADAIRTEVSTLAGATEVGAQAFGPMRGGLFRATHAPFSTDGGATSQIGFADVYHMAPLGADPTAQLLAPSVPPSDPQYPVQAQRYLNALPGYPLVRLNIPTIFLRMTFEGTLQASLAVSGDFFVGTSGLTVHYDLTRTPFNTAAVDPNNPATLFAPGWVTFMQLGDGTIMYDVSNTGWAATGFFNPIFITAPGSPPTFRSIATTFYVAKFASAFGIPVFNSSFQRITTDAELAATIVRRGDQSAIKDYEAIAQFVRGQCATNGGQLPSEYNQKVPRRVVNCTGGCPAP